MLGFILCIPGSLLYPFIAWGVSGEVPVIAFLTLGLSLGAMLLYSGR